MAKNTAKGTSGQPSAEAPVQKKGIVAKAQEFKTFFEESQVEMKKVTWPTKKETLSTCAAVLVLVVIMSLFLGIVDLGLSKIVEVVLS